MDEGFVGGVTHLLEAARDGDPAAVDALLPLVYDRLRELAARRLRAEAPGHTLDATALVHEAYIKLAAGSRLDARDRAHFLALASRAMRQVLVDHARHRGARKRDGGWARTTLTAGLASPELDVEELLALDAALDSLEPRQRRIVECRFFGGMEETEIAQVLGVSDRTVRRDWVRARAWLYATLYGPPPDESSPASDPGPAETQRT